MDWGGGGGVWNDRDYVGFRVYRDKCSRVKGLRFVDCRV